MTQTAWKTRTSRTAWKARTARTTRTSRDSHGPEAAVTGAAIVTSAVTRAATGHGPGLRAPIREIAQNRVRSPAPPPRQSRGRPAPGR